MDKNSKPTTAPDPAAPASLGDLPEWDLSDLYSGPDAPEFARDLERLEASCAEFAAAYEGKLKDLDAAAMRDCILSYEEIDLTAGRIMSFAA